MLSRILETSVDREDKIYRWGGEEFLLLPHSPIGRALILAEGIRQAVSEYQTLSVTVSIGVAEHHDGETVEQLFSRVDKALYAAKMTGVIGSRACLLTALSDGAVEMAPPE